MDEVKFPSYVSEFVSLTQNFLNILDLKLELSSESFEAQSKTYFISNQAEPIQVIIHQTANSMGNDNKQFRCRVHALMAPELGEFVRDREAVLNRYATLGAIISETDSVSVAFQCLIPISNSYTVAGILAAAIAHAKNSLIRSIQQELSPKKEKSVESLSAWGDIDFEKIQYNYAHLGLGSCEKRSWQLNLYPSGVLTLIALHNNPFWGGGLLCLSRIRPASLSDRIDTIDINQLNSVSDLFSETPTFGAWCRDGDDLVFIQFLPNFLKELPNITDLVVLWARMRIRSFQSLLEVYESFYVKDSLGGTAIASVLGNNDNLPQQEETIDPVSNLAQQGQSLKDRLIYKVKNIFKNSLKSFDEAYKVGDFVQALKIGRPLAEQGDPGAQLLLGLMYYFGQGVDRNIVESAKWMELSAEKTKIPLSQQIVGNNYLLGDGVEKNVAKGIHWLRLAARQGFAPAQFDLAKVLEEGIGGEINLTEAAHLYELANLQPTKNWNGFSAIDAMKNNSFEVPVATLIELKTRLGLIYFNGNGVTEDPARAATFFLEAMQLGGTFACCFLAAMYEDGVGVEQNYHKAVELYKTAATREMPLAQSRLATLLEKGLGIEMNLREALKLYKQAAAHGDTDAAAGVGRLQLLIEPGSDEDL